MRNNPSALVYDSALPRIAILEGAVEVWRYRDLLVNLVQRDLRVRYKRSVLGVIWVMLNPLLMMAVISFVFSALFRSTTPHVSTYILSGILIMNFFSQATTAAMTSLQQNSSVIKRIYIPASIFVFAAVGSALVNLLFAFVPFLALSILDGVTFDWHWLYLLLPILQLVMFTSGIGLIISAVGIFFADTYELYQVFLQMFLFATPVMYPITILPALALQLQQFNPMFYVLFSFRMVVLENRFPAIRLSAGGTLFAFLVFFIGWVVFIRLERRFAYIL